VHQKPNEMREREEVRKKNPVENSSKIKTKKQKKEKDFRAVPSVMCDSQHTDVHGPLAGTRPRHEPVELRMT
jgi:hypothetical protein